MPAARGQGFSGNQQDEENNGSSSVFSQKTVKSKITAEQASKYWRNDDALQKIGTRHGESTPSGARNPPDEE